MSCDFPRSQLHEGQGEKANVSHEYCEILGGYLIGLFRGSHFTSDRELLIFQMKFKERALDASGPVLLVCLSN